MPKNNVTSKFFEKHWVDRNYQCMFTKDGFQSLRTYLSNAAKGNPKIYTAPFAKGVSMEQVLSDWKATLESIAQKWPSLLEFENDLANKVGPLSVQKPTRERFDDIRQYYDGVSLPSKPILPEAIKAGQNEFVRLRGLRCRSQKATLEKMKKSTSSGPPWQTKKRNVLQDVIPSVIKAWYGQWPTVEALIQGSQWTLPAVLGWRGQEGGMSADDVKQRVVWMFPFSLNLCELQVYQPLIEGAQSLNLVPAWVSNESVDREVTQLFDSKSDDDLIVCTDFSKFDQHFNRDLQESAKAMLDFLLMHGPSEDRWLNEVFPCKYFIELAWDTTNDGFVSLFRGFHGMASGSGGTNVDETLAHRTLQHEAAILNGSKLNPHSMCLGDDGILTYPGITVNDVVDAYQSHGQECNLDKQYASTQDCVYLRRWHHKNYRQNGICVGVYSTNRALGRLRYLERFMDPEVWSPTMVALRQLSIIENCKWHPLFEQFVEFCMKRDRFRLGIDIPGFLDNIASIAKEAIDYMPDFLGYTKTLQGGGPEGITEWRVVQYLKSRA